MVAQLEVADWRRRVSAMYDAVRTSSDPRQAHHDWRAARDELFGRHPQTPLLPDDPLRTSGLAYFPYDPGLRFVVPVVSADGPDRTAASVNDGAITMRRFGTIDLPEPVGATLDVWWLTQYGGGIFLPVRDGTAGTDSYGGGRYLLDTVKGADLGWDDRDARDEPSLVVDLNFLYHPSCRYNPAWECPLAPEGNTVAAPIYAGERL